MLTLNKQECSDLNRLRDKEWLLTNGIGGYASTTVSGMNTRRYHGLLVAATHPPVGRFVLLSKLEDALLIDGQRVELSTNQYGEDVVHPSGYRHLESFSLDPFPVSTFCGEHFSLTKSIFMLQGYNTVVVEYDLASYAGEADIQLEVRPLIAFRDYHATTHENEALDRTLQQSFGCVSIQPYADLPALHFAHDADNVLTEGVWYRNFELIAEKERGLDHREDLFSPMVFKTSLKGRRRFVLIASTEKRCTTEAETYRHAAYRKVGLRQFQSNSLGESADFVRKLEHAADQFLVARPPFKTVIAGYHWFADWGRDTMIALPGLLLSTDQSDAAKEILLEFCKAIDGGMLPNRFPDQGETPEYNTVDATLWFFEALWQYLNCRTDPTWKEEAWHLIETSFYPVLKNVVQLHLAGTRYGIHADADGFLWAGDASTQLTWMDAKVGDIAITPRAGRAVEIQALWYNSLRIMEEFARQFRDHEAAEQYAGIADKLRDNFESVFWNHERECLFDVAGGDWVDASIRPNQVIAISLRHCMLPPESALKVLNLSEQELLTPYGLRTLSPTDPKYRGRYEGDVWSRDSAYHQGTVWPWLAGPFFTAKLRFSPDRDAVIRETETWLERFSGHLKEAGLGQISEIFDGDAPHQPRGCIAQAWSVAELLRLAKTIGKVQGSRSSKGLQIKR